jgi:hypothetical protein
VQACSRLACTPSVPQKMFIYLSKFVLQRVFF